MAVRLTQLHTQKREHNARLSHRLESCEELKKGVEWLWPKYVSNLDSLIAKVPDGLSQSAAKRYARRLQADQVARAKAILADSIPALALLDAELDAGELRLRANGALILDSVFVLEAESTQMLVNWKLVARHFSGRERVDIGALTEALSTPRLTKIVALAEQIEAILEELESTICAIRAEEMKLDKLCYGLFGLSANDIAMIERG